MNAVIASRPLATIVEADLLRLIENRVPEGEVIDFKLQPDLDTEKGKREFVKDVVAFANASGGVIIYGMDEERVDGQPSGVPATLVGIDVPNDDLLLRQCRSMLDDGVDERIAGVEMRVVRLGSGKAAFLVRIPRSLQAPHQVTRDKDYRFYGRNGAQRSILTRAQVRDIVLRNADRYEAIKEQHLRRLREYQQGRPFGFTMFHVIPLVPQPDAFDLASAETIRWLQGKLAPPLYTELSSYGFIHCLDGYKAYLTDPANYALLLRDGSLEFVEQFSLRQEARLIPAVQVERALHQSFDLAKRLYGEGTLAVPFVLCLSMTGLANKLIGLAREGRTLGVPEINFGSILVTDAGVGAPVLMKPWMDLLWQSAGWQRALTYNEDGSWHRPLGGA